MSKLLAKMSASTARQLERRAEVETDPAKREKLLRKAAKQWREVHTYGGEVPPGRIAVQSPQQIDGPTVRLRPGTPGLPARSPRAATAGESAGQPSTLKVGLAGLAVVVLLAFVVSLFGSGDDDVPAAPAADEAVAAAATSDDRNGVPNRYSPDDHAACEQAREALNEFGEYQADLQSVADLGDAQATLLVAAERFQGAMVTADDPGVESAMREGMDLLREMSSAMGRLDVAGVEAGAERTEAVFGRMVTACAPVYLEH
ncbi:hypothetical protein WIS52_15810 [Pseudonocardia nematodicida]|uniref:DUF5667 domain-containing protein n=1 Tax=Pseudonocardia nematodicida TaxID=1206997 RepID=A0ABV1KBT9_9PSEU